MYGLRGRFCWTVRCLNLHMGSQSLSNHKFVPVLVIKLILKTDWQKKRIQIPVLTDNNRTILIHQVVLHLPLILDLKKKLTYFKMTSVPRGSNLRSSHSSLVNNDRSVNEITKFRYLKVFTNEQMIKRLAYLNAYTLGIFVNVSNYVFARCAIKSKKNE